MCTPLETFCTPFGTLTVGNPAGLQRVAEGLLWKLEKENEAVAKPSILHSHKYNIMITYAHKNQELCLQTHNELVKHGFNVWLGRECLHGSTMIGIVNAIENSENVYRSVCRTHPKKVFILVEWVPEFVYLLRICCL
ncbi:unnamed protein product [Rotaria magnacalcarata]|uniref:TIR domain-containing protein n=1 Tax=Rotaria magnacalcarata TaxID=392030 RepID=A0A816MWY6_9BILA|nr:unnamed protein product [Rotaria magnacalcarata]